MASPKTPFRVAMDQGNDWYRAAQTSQPESLKPERALRAARCYEQAQGHSSDPMEHSSALKNKFKAHAIVALAEGGLPAERGHHFREALACLGKALHLAAVPAPAQTPAWTADLFRCAVEFIDNAQACGTGEIQGLFGVLEDLANRKDGCLIVRVLAAMELLREAQRRAACRSAEKEYQAMKAVIGRVDSLAQSLDDFCARLVAPPVAWPPEVLATIKEQAAEVASGVAASRREAEGRCHLALGHAARSRARVEVVDEMTFHIQTALDHYRCAILSNYGKDIPLEAEARAYIGVMFSDFLRNKEAAHTHFADAVRLVHAGEVFDLRDRDWFRRALNAVSDRQKELAAKDAAARDAERQPHLEELKADLDALSKEAEKGARELFEHIYKTYKPGGVAKPPEKDSKGNAYSVSRLAVQTTVHFHPDKSASLDRKTQILYEEITRHLTNVINNAKGV